MPKAKDYAHTTMAITTLGLQIATEIVPVPGADVVLNVMENIKDACFDAKVKRVCCVSNLFDYINFKLMRYRINSMT